ncbi:MAG: DUF1571 domain-containing protein [Phycisphaerae bacterium]
MDIRRLLRPTNRKVRVFVGLILAGLFAVQCTQSTVAFKQSSGVVAVGGQASGEEGASTMAKLERLAASDHIAFLDHCLKNCRETYRDYTCEFTKQEVINGQTKPQQKMQVKFMGRPFSVCMTWVQNPPTGDKVLYVEGLYGNKMLVRPAAKFLQAILPTVTRSPDDAEAMQATLRPVNMFGFERGLESLLDVYRLAQKQGDLKQSSGGYAKVGDRTCFVLVRNLPDKPDYQSVGEKTVVFVDTQYLVPIRLEAYDWAGKPLCAYEYSDIKFNVGLKSEDFIPENNGLKTPK